MKNLKLHMEYLLNVVDVFDRVEILDIPHGIGLFNKQGEILCKIENNNFYVFNKRGSVNRFAVNAFAHAIGISLNIVNSVLTYNAYYNMTSKGFHYIKDNSKIDLGE